MTRHEEKTQAIAASVEQTVDVRESDQWMVLAFKVTENGSLQMHRTTWNFPHEMFRPAQTLLHKVLAEDMYGPPIEPLPPRRKNDELDPQSAGSRPPDIILEQNGAAIADGIAEESPGA